VLLILLFAWIYSKVGMQFESGAGWIPHLYFSVVTLTTLGYGDIVPVSSTARVVAMIEVTMGYLLLGGLLSIFANKMARRGE
jgi:hypothetical protein